MNSYSKYVHQRDDGWQVYEIDDGPLPDAGRGPTCYWYSCVGMPMLFYTSVAIRALAKVYPTRRAARRRARDVFSQKRIEKYARTAYEWAPLPRSVAPCMRMEIYLRTLDAHTKPIAFDNDGNSVSGMTLDQWRKAWSDWWVATHPAPAPAPDAP